MATACGARNRAGEGGDTEAPRAGRSGGPRTMRATRMAVASRQRWLQSRPCLSWIRVGTVGCRGSPPQALHLASPGTRIGLSVPCLQMNCRLCSRIFAQLWVLVGRMHQAQSNATTTSSARLELGRELFLVAQLFVCPSRQLGQPLQHHRTMRTFTSGISA